MMIKNQDQIVAFTVEPKHIYKDNLAFEEFYLYKGVLSKFSLGMTPITAASIVSVFGDVKDFNIWFANVLETMRSFREFLYTPLNFLPLALNEVFKDTFFLTIMISLALIGSTLKLRKINSEFLESWRDLQDPDDENNEDDWRTSYMRMVWPLFIFGLGYSTAYGVINEFDTYQMLLVFVSFQIISVMAYFIFLVFAMLFVSLILIPILMPKLNDFLRKDWQKEKYDQDKNPAIAIGKTKYPNPGEINQHHSIKEYIVARAAQSYVPMIDSLLKILSEGYRDQIVKELKSEGYLINDPIKKRHKYKLLITDGTTSLPEFLKRGEKDQNEDQYKDQLEEMRILFVALRREFFGNILLVALFVFSFFIAFSQISLA